VGAARVRGGAVAAPGALPHFACRRACPGAGVWRGPGAAAGVSEREGGGRMSLQGLLLPRSASRLTLLNGYPYTLLFTIELVIANN